MGKFFHDNVEQALKHIFYDMRSGNADGQKGFELLSAATDQGDGDAAYFLARCLAGYQFVWSKHRFPEDNKRVIQLMKRSVELGSAVGVLGGLRTLGVMSAATMNKMPFENLNAAWDVVYEKAEAGEPFCQYMIGNAYFWGDILRIKEQSEKNFDDEQGYVRYLKQNVTECISWFEKSFIGGVDFAGQNLISLYRDGKGAIFPAQPEKRDVIIRQGAEIGYPNFQGWYAKDLYEKGDFDEAFRWYEKAVAGGQSNHLYRLGRMYEEGQGVDKDVHHALHLYEKAIQLEQSDGGYNSAGQIYYQGAPGIPQDYAKAVHYFECARKKNNKWANDMLAHCHIQGLGCSQNVLYARQLLEEVDWNSDLKKCCLGLIYADGLGVAQDIPRGVKYLQAAGDLPEAKQALMRFKKTLFGKWVKRS